MSQRAWAADKFNTPNVLACAIANAGHFPWIDNPADVRAAFAAFAATLIDD